MMRSRPPIVPRNAVGRPSVKNTTTLAERSRTSAARDLLMGEPEALAIVRPARRRHSVDRGGQGSPEAVCDLEPVRGPRLERHETQLIDIVVEVAG